MQFWDKVDSSKGVDACWPYTGAKAKLRGNYGVAWWGSKRIKAHRLAWFLHNKSLPANMLVCHTCDNPVCCNPKHLFLGTNEDNMHDKILKGRQCRGEKYPLAKLTEKTVQEIVISTDSGAFLAKQFKVSEGLISGIRTGKRWKHVVRITP